MLKNAVHRGLSAIFHDNQKRNPIMRPRNFVVEQREREKFDVGTEMLYIEG